MPDSLEFPRVLGAVVPQVRACRAVVGELLADRFPGFAAVIGTLKHLSKPTARLRRIEAIWINRRTFHVIDLPTGKMGSAHVPFLAFSVCRQNERAFARAYQY